jgi:hypothetical protein
LFDHHGYISKLDFFFLDKCGYQRDGRRGFGLISDTRPTLVTTYWKLQFVVLASPPSLSSIGPVTNRARSIIYTQLLLGYGHF